MFFPNLTSCARSNISKHLKVAYDSIFDKINIARAYCHVSPARVQITRALKVNPKTNMAAAKKKFSGWLPFSKLLENGCSPGRRVITGLPFNRCWSLGFRKRLFCPVNEVYRASVTRFITMSPSHEANEESRPTRNYDHLL